MNRHVAAAGGVNDLLPVVPDRKYDLLVHIVTARTGAGRHSRRRRRQLQDRLGHRDGAVSTAPSSNGIGLGTAALEVTGPLLEGREQDPRILRRPKALHSRLLRSGATADLRRARSVTAGRQNQRQASEQSHYGACTHQTWLIPIQFIAGYRLPMLHALLK